MLKQKLLPLHLAPVWEELLEEEWFPQGSRRPPQDLQDLCVALVVPLLA